MDLIFNIVGYAVQWAIETGFLLLALWVMARIQKLQYTVLGLLLCAALACLFDLIPYVGHYIALPVLWVCLTKVTREDFTGVAFTAAISYALVFGMNLFLLGALMGDLRPSVRARTLDVPVEQSALTAASDDEGDTMLETASDENGPTTSSPTAPTKPAPVAPQPAPPRAEENSHLADGFVLKGVTQNGRNSTAMLSIGGKSHSLFLGETISAETSAGRKIIRLEKVEKASVLLDIGGQLTRVTYAPTP